MVHLDGDENFDQPPQLVWQSLTDPRFLCECFPGVDSIVRADEHSAALVVRPGFSFVRGTLEVSFQFADVQPPRVARVAIQLKGIGSSAILDARFEVTPFNAGSRVTWSAGVRELGGLLKAVSHGLLEGAARKVAADTWQQVRCKLARRSN